MDSIPDPRLGLTVAPRGRDNANDDASQGPSQGSVPPPEMHSGNPSSTQISERDRLSTRPQGLGLHGSQIHLISRPQVQDDLDPSIGFSYGQRIRINPKHFNRPKLSNSALPNILRFAEVTLPQSSTEKHAKLFEGGSYMADHQPTHLHVPAVPELMSHIPNQQSHLKLQDSAEMLIGIPRGQSEVNYDSAKIDVGIPIPSAQPQARNLPFSGDESMLHPPLRLVHHRETATNGNFSMPPAIILSSQALASSPAVASRPSVAPVAPCLAKSPLFGDTFVLRQRCQSDEHFSRHRSPKETIIPPSARISRTSLRNDTSVSLGDPARTISQYMSPHPRIVNHPMKDGHGIYSNNNNPSSRARASSISSSKSMRKREPRPNMSSTSRFLRNCDSHARDVTSLVPRKRRVPDYQLGDFRSKLSTTIVELTGRLNDKFKNIDHDVDQHIETIADLKHRIKKQQGEMSRHKKQTMGKDAAIHRLEEEQDRLMERLHNAEQELEVRSARVSKLEEKGKSYKRFLNSAVAEQQELYKVTKSKCEAAICELKAQETRRRALQEQERTQAEAAREKLNGMVKATVAEFRSKEQEYDNKIEALTQIVRQRDEDILRERATAQSLLKQNSSISKVHEALKDFGARMDDAVLKFDHFTSSAPTQDSYIGAETCARIDRIMDLLQDRFDRGTTPASLPNHIQEQIEKAVNSILNKLQPLSDSQHSTHEILSLLLSSLENFASDIWDVIEELQDTIEEYWSQRQDKTLQEQIDSLTTRIRDKETECNSCSQLLLASNETAREQRNLIDQLRNEIMDLEHAQAESFQQSEQLQLLRNDCEKWRQDAAMKANLVSDLEHKLQEAESAMLRNSSTREGEIEDLRKHLLRKVEKSRVARRQAVEATRQGAIIRMGKVKAEFDKRLAQALEERLALQSAVAAAKQKMQNIETETVRNSDKVSNLEAELQTVQDQSVRDRKESQQKEAKQDTILQQQVNHINDLQIQLDSSEAKFKNLADHVLAYDKAAQLVLRNLKQWTKGYGAIQKLASTSTKLENKKLAQIDPKFKPLIQLQMLQKAVIEHCETQAERRGHTKIDIGEALATTETKARRSSWPTLSTTGIKQVSNVLAGSLFGPLRRVTIRSPISNAPSPQPLSIRAEQERRRLTEAPRSIMKVATLSQIQLLDDGTPQEDLAQEQEEPFQKGNNVTQVDAQGKKVEAGKRRCNSATNRGLNNRLVVGSNPNHQLSSFRPRSQLGARKVSNIQIDKTDEIIPSTLGDRDRKRMRQSSP